MHMSEGKYASDGSLHKNTIDEKKAVSGSHNEEVHEYRGVRRVDNCSRDRKGRLHGGSKS